MLGCTKRYTDPSSLRKHVKSHSAEEQEQYRRTKDLANLAKRSTSPTARYSSWTPGPATTLNPGPSVILEEQHLLTSSSTLLQTGGTLMTMEDMSSSSPAAPGVPSPLMPHKSREPSQRSKIFKKIHFECVFIFELFQMKVTHLTRITKHLLINKILWTIWITTRFLLITYPYVMTEQVCLFLRYILTVLICFFFLCRFVQ